jgi:protein-disulfide isomerase
VFRRTPSKRVLFGAAGGAVLLVVAVVLAIVFTRSSSSNDASVKNPLPHAGRVQRLLGGIPQTGNVLGNPSAPVTLVEYLDVQSRASRKFETTSLPQLISRYVRSGKLKVVARPTARFSTESVAGRFAVIAAGDQNKFFNLLQLLFLNQGRRNSGWLNTALVMRAGASVPGLDAGAVIDSSRAGHPSSRASQFDAAASADHVRALPTILVGKTGGKLRKVALKSSVDTRSVRAAVDAALR